MVEEVALWNKLDQEAAINLTGGWSGSHILPQDLSTLISMMPSSLKSAHDPVTPVCPRSLAGALFPPCARRLSALWVQARTPVPPSALNA